MYNKENTRYNATYEDSSRLLILTGIQGNNYEYCIAKFGLNGKRPVKSFTNYFWVHLFKTNFLLLLWQN